MNLSRLTHDAKHFTVANAPTILTAVGVTGTLTTAYLTAKSTALAIDRVHQLDEEYSDEDLHDKDIVKEIWKFYIPPAISATTTIVAIIWANRMNANRIAGLAAAYTLSERAFSEYKAKVYEKVGEKREQDIRDEIAEDRQKQAPIEGAVIIPNNGGVLCYEQFTGRYFMSDMENIRQAENDLNYDILHDGYASLTEFYNKLDIPSTEFSSLVGWNTDDPMKLVYSTVLSDDNRPCISIIFDPHPTPDFDRFGF